MLFKATMQAVFMSTSLVSGSVITYLLPPLAYRFSLLFQMFMTLLWPQTSTLVEFGQGSDGRPLKRARNWLFRQHEKRGRFPRPSRGPIEAWPRSTVLLGAALTFRGSAAAPLKPGTGRR